MIENSIIGEPVKGTKAVYSREDKTQGDVIAVSSTIWKDVMCNQDLPAELWVETTG